MVSAPPSICPGEWDAQNPLGFWDTNGSANLGQMAKPYNNQQKKNRTWRIVYFAVPADYRLKLKEIQMSDKYVDIAGELKKTNKLWNLKVTVILIIIGTLGRVTQGLVLGR